MSGGTFNRANDPAAPATVSDFRLDKYEVTLARFRSFMKAWTQGWRPMEGAGKHAHLNEGKGLHNTATGMHEPGWSPSQGTSMWTSFVEWSGHLSYACFETWSDVEGPLDRLAFDCVLWQEAVAFCIWDGGFLPSEAEWNYAAAGGTEQRNYPWGFKPPTNDASLAVWNCDGCAPAVPGSRPTGNARWGQSDLAGNVTEWTLDEFSPSFVTPCIDCTAASAAPVANVIRGGHSVSSSDGLMTSARASTHTRSGFRCARAP